ncbi:MAG TPA: DUF6279 family lipoprotein [Burkholderiaceae bacterium]
MRPAIIAALCLVLGLFGGCSALRLGYSTAPSLVYWWLDRYVDFNGAQTVKAEAALAQWFRWHRRSELPDYAALLARAELEVTADTTGARVCEWQADLIKRAETAFDHAVPAAAEIVLTITPEQITHIEGRYAKVNEEFADDYLQADPSKRAAATLKRTVERAEMLYGKLDTGQRASMGAALARSPFDPALWLSERQARQRDALELLRQLTQGKATREQAEAALRAYAERIERSPSEAYRRYWERLSAFNCGFAATLHNGTSAAQRRHAVQTLAGWEGDLRAIAAKADPVPVE